MFKKTIDKIEDWYYENVLEIWSVAILIIIVVCVTSYGRWSTYHDAKEYCGGEPYDYKNVWFDLGMQGVGVQCNELSSPMRCGDIKVQYSTACTEYDKFGFCENFETKKYAVCTEYKGI